MVVGSPTKLNLIPSGVMPVVYINQGDAGYDKEFLVYNGDSPYNVPSGVSATIRGTKADGYGVTEAATVTTGSNLVTVTITEQMVAAAGANLYELVFVDTDGLRIATINMVWAVKPDALGDSVISDSDLDYVNQALDKIQNAEAMKDQLNANTAAIANETEARIAADNTETAARILADNTLQTNINSEASTRATQDGVLQSQIDQLVAPTGTAPSAAEIENARIGADGEVYTTLGSAIRGQVGDLQNNLALVNGYTDSPMIASAAASTKVAWRKETVLSGISLTAKVAYNFHVEYETTVSNSTYLYLYDSNDTELTFFQIGNGVASKDCIYENSIDRTGVYAQINSSAVGIVAHVTLSRYNQASEVVKETVIPITYPQKYLNLAGSSVNINNPQESGVGMCVSIYPCVENDVFTINATGVTSARAWGFIKSDGTIIIAAPADKTCVNDVIIAPPDSAYLIVEDNSGRRSYVGKTYDKTLEELAETDAQHNGFVFSDTEPATFKLGFDVNSTTGKYTPLSWAAVFDEDSYCKIDDGVSQVVITTTINSGAFVRFYDADLNFLGNGGYSQGKKITAYVLASMNPRLSKDAKYFKVGIEKAAYTDPSLITYTHATPGKFVKQTSDPVMAKTLNNIGVFSPLSDRVGSYDAETAHHKYFTLLFGTDFHGDYNRLANFEKFANLGNGEKYYSMFDIAINGGDSRHYRNTETDCGWYNGVALGGVSWVDSVTNDFKIPYMYTIGNHDVGFSTSLECLDDAECHDLFFANTVLYNESKKPYGYYDNDDYKIRIICLYDYDSGLLELAETNSWATLPVVRGYGVMFRQAQLDWFAQTLNSVPTGYKVIVLSHNAVLYREYNINFNFDFTDANFNPGTWRRNSYAVQGFRNSDGGGMGVIADIVQAYIDKTTISDTYSYSGNDYWSSDLTYWSDVTADYDFSNANGEFAFYLCGHVHRDVEAACTMTGYEKQKLIAADTGSLETYQRGSALAICRNMGAESENSLLAIVVNTDEDVVNLVNIGATLTSNNTEKAVFTLDISMT